MKQSVTLNVQGMRCGHCVQHVERALKSVEGVSEVEVDLLNGKATITYTSDTANLEAMKGVVREAGYTVAD